LLFNDLHAGNVLAGRRQPWLLIDPKPYVGDPHYDVVQHLLNCDQSLQADPIGLLTEVAGVAVSTLGASGSGSSHATSKRPSTRVHPGQDSTSSCIASVARSRRR
jgi:hypothetical protein